MADPKRISPRLRILIFVAGLAVVSFCSFLLWPRAHRELPIVYQVPAGDHAAAADGSPPAATKGPVKGTHGEADPAKGAPAGSGTTKWEKPKGFKIVAVIFYGRARFVNILDCYLKRNLVSRGGYLDEVRFIVNTKHQSDLDWLDELVKTDPLYTKSEKSTEDVAFDSIWTGLQEADTLYVKMDDDLIYIDDDAIPRVVQTLQAHPEAHDVAANIVNSPLAHWLHYHTGAILPYVPEARAPDPPPPAGPAGKHPWRASELPRAEPPAADEWAFPPRPHDGFPVGAEGGPAYRGQRWLPLEPTPANLYKTPIRHAAYDPYGKGWTEWTMAAQQHYSFLDRLERGDLTPYWAGGPDGVWNMQYKRYNLNFLAIWGSSVAMQLPGADDEQWLTVDIPLKFKRPCLVDTHAIIGHFAFGTTPELEATDLLDRYMAYANERVCEAENQRATLDPKYYNATSWHLQQGDGWH